jgi:hypothetical protein
MAAASEAVLRPSKNVGDQFQSVIQPKFGRDTTIGSIEHAPNTRELILDKPEYAIDLYVILKL